MDQYMLTEFPYHQSMPLPQTYQGNVHSEGMFTTPSAEWDFFIPEHVGQLHEEGHVDRQTLNKELPICNLN